VCCAYVGSATPDEVATALRRELAGYKNPKELHHVAEIPRSANGKVRRTLIAHELGLG
jgi:acyl-CoA synthetase (AMP-forming)/AMP-acid ligase II